MLRPAVKYTEGIFSETYDEENQKYQEEEYERNADMVVLHVLFTVQGHVCAVHKIHKDEGQQECCP